MKQVPFQKYDLEKKVSDFLKKYKSIFLEDYNPLFYTPKQIEDFINKRAEFAEKRCPKVYPFPWYFSEARRARSEFPWSRFFKEHPSPILPPKITKEDLDKSALYQIIRKGGSLVGPRRGILFAFENQIPLEIPIAYFFELKDKHILQTIHPLLQKLDPKTLCALNYFNSKKRIIEMSLEEAIEHTIKKNRSIVFF